MCRHTPYAERKCDLDRTPFICAHGTPATAAEPSPVPAGAGGTLLGLGGPPDPGVPPDPSLLLVPLQPGQGRAGLARSGTGQLRNWGSHPSTPPELGFPPILTLPDPPKFGFLPSRTLPDPGIGVPPWLGCPWTLSPSPWRSRVRAPRGSEPAGCGRAGLSELNLPQHHCLRSELAVSSE